MGWSIGQNLSLFTILLKVNVPNMNEPIHTRATGVSLRWMPLIVNQPRFIGIYRVSLVPYSQCVGRPPQNLNTVPTKLLKSTSKSETPQSSYVKDGLVVASNPTEGFWQNSQGVFLPTKGKTLFVCHSKRSPESSRVQEPKI